MSDKSIVQLTEGISPYLVRMFATKAKIDNLEAELSLTRHRITKIYQPLIKIIIVVFVASAISAGTVFYLWSDATPNEPPRGSFSLTIAAYKESAQKVDDKYSPLAVTAVCTLVASLFFLMFSGEEMWQKDGASSLYRLLDRVWDTDEGNILAEMNASGSQKELVNVVDRRLRSRVATVLDLESSNATKHELDRARLAFTNEYELYSELGIISQRRKFYFSEEKS